MELRILLVPFALMFSACDSGEGELTIEKLEFRINRINSEISQLVESSTGRTSDDCRTKFISGGDDCGPVIVYGIVGIDTTRLQNLFAELSEAKAALFELQENKPVCDIAFPAKDSLINGKCLGCYPTAIENTFECF